MALRFLNSGYFAGKVGIGTDSPNYKLAVYGSSADSEIVASFGSGNDQNEYTAIGLSGFIASNGATKAGIALKRTGVYGTGELHFLNNNTLNNSDMTLSDSKMMINASGNVGIGTTSPAAGLQVAKGGTTIPVAGSSTASAVFGNSTSDDNYGLVIGANGGGTGYITSQRTDGGTSIYPLAIQPNGGKVGIGTDNPLTPLHVLDDSSANARAKIRIQGGATSGYGDLAVQSGYIRLIINDTDSTAYSASNQFNYINGNVATTLNSNGLGVGTTLPAFKLDVEGTFGVSDLPFNADSVSVLVADETIGVEEVTNGSFTTDADWTKDNGWAIGGGTANGTSAVTPIYQTISGFTAGNVYKVRFEVTAVTSGYIRVYAYVGTNGTFTNIFNSTSLTTGVYESTFEFGGTNKILRFYGSVAATGGFTGSIDNVSVKQVTSASNQIQKRELGTGAFGPTPVGAYLPLSGGTMTGDLNLNDNVELRFGDDLDLRMEHDGGGGYIQNYTGNFTIRNYADDTSIIFQNDDGAGGIETYFQLEGASGGASPFTVFPDNSNLAFGSGHDLRLYHNGSVSYITNYTGTLDISNNADNADINFRNDNGAGAVSTYFYLDGSLTNGTTILGATRFPDNSKIYMGTGGDLEIYHDGSNSYIKDNGTGTLNLQGSTQVLIGGTNGEVGVQYVENAGVGLRHNNVTKLTTESTGINVVGDIKIDSALLSNQENTDIDTGSEVVAQVSTSTYTAAFFDFVIKKTTNVRSGTVYACHDGTNVEFTETSTNDLGDTSDVTLSVDISGTNMRLLATVTSDDWSIKSLIRAI